MKIFHLWEINQCKILDQNNQWSNNMSKPKNKIKDKGSQVICYIFNIGQNDGIDSYRIWLTTKNSWSRPISKNKYKIKCLIITIVLIILLILVINLKSSFLPKKIFRMIWLNMWSNKKLQTRSSLINYGNNQFKTTLIKILIHSIKKANGKLCSNNTTKNSEITLRCLRHIQSQLLFLELS